MGCFEAERGRCWKVGMLGACLKLLNATLNCLECGSTVRVSTGG